MEKVATSMEHVTDNTTKLTSKKIIQDLMKKAGLTLNGSDPWDLQVHHEGFYSRVVNDGILGLGESYMDKWWDCQRLDIFFEKILKANIANQVKLPFYLKWRRLFANVVNKQTRSRAKIVAQKHYNLGNELFNNMLDSRMIYSCGYWKDAHTLEHAQIAKLELTCQKLKLKPGLRLLDIGCGWGGLAKYAAENYGVSVVGVTISEQQVAYAQQYCKGLPIDIRLLDYRDIHETFDRIVSVGMFEHVGHLNYKNFMAIAHRSLADDGLFLLHTIGMNDTIKISNEWITKYIFPNGIIPSATQIDKAYQEFFIMEDWHNFGAYYDNTLMAWYENFSRHWDDLKANYDERFYRMWVFYLLSCAGSFRCRFLQLWQIVFSKHGIPGGYIAPR